MIKSLFTFVYLNFAFACNAIVLIAITHQSGYKKWCCLVQSMLHVDWSRYADLHHYELLIHKMTISIYIEHAKEIIQLKRCIYIYIYIYIYQTPYCNFPLPDGL